MIASSRLFVVIALVACTTQRRSVERHLEHELVMQYGIVGSVSCPSVETQPGDPVTCEVADGGEPYRVIQETETWQDGSVQYSQTRVVVLSSDGVLIPTSVVAHGAGVQLECADQRRYLRVVPGTPGYCKVAGTDDYLRVTVPNLEARKWVSKRIAGPMTEARKIVTRSRLDATITCSELALADKAPATCAITTRSGERFEMTYSLGHLEYELLRDGSRVVVLPAVLEDTATSAELPLRCPRRVVRPDEAVRCSYVKGGKQASVDVVIDARGNARMLASR